MSCSLLAVKTKIVRDLGEATGALNYYRQLAARIAASKRTIFFPPVDRLLHA